MKKITIYEYISYICILVGTICLSYFLYKVYGGFSIAEQVNEKSIDNSAKIGDFIGGVIGSTWTLASVLLYFSALKLQSKEITNSKKILNQQQFETTFFNLLKTQQDIKYGISDQFYSVDLNSVGFKYNSKEVKGGTYFSNIVLEYRSLYRLSKKQNISEWNEDEVESTLQDYFESEERRNNHPEDIDQMDKDFFSAIKSDYTAHLYGIHASTFNRIKNAQNENTLCQLLYAILYIRYDNTLGHYCRHLYNIIKYLDAEKERTLEDAKAQYNSKKLEKENKAINDRFDTYIAFIQSMLSASEMIALFYNSLIFKKAQDLFVKYQLFENLSKEKLIKIEHANLITGIILKSNRDLFDTILNRE